MRHILSIAGSDSCAGAGLQADLKTISALGAYGLNVVTAITAQNTCGVYRVQAVDSQMVKAQLETIFSDIRVDAVKIGMLADGATMETVASYLSAHRQEESHQALPLVLDPVMVAKGGATLMEKSGTDILISKLLPLVDVLTPNLPEAEVLTGIKIRTIDDMKAACLRILQMGPQWVVVKGGHLPGEPVDVVGHGNNVYQLPGHRVETNNNHGTGCTLSSAIATYLGGGCDVLTAISKAKGYVETVMQKGFPIGSGIGVLNHFALFKSKGEDIVC